MERNGPDSPNPSPAELTGRLYEILEGEFDIRQLQEVLNPLAGRAVMAIEGPAYQLGTHRQLGVRWLKPALNEQQLANPLTKAAWMRDGVEFIYAQAGHDADGNVVLVGEYYVEDGGLIGVKIEDIEALKVVAVLEQNQFDQDSDRYDDNIISLMQDSMR